MKNLIILYTCFFSQVVFSQSNAGFNSYEAKDMIAICNSFSYQEMYGSDAAIVPKEYKLIYASADMGMDNKFQVFAKDDLGVICFRGSTDDRKSWLENFYSSMIPAKGKINIKGEDFNYNFSEDTSAAVHAGYSLGLAYMNSEIITQIKTLNSRNIYRIILTGHSQGGALSLLTRAHLESLLGNDISINNVFKVYTYANPMVGNDSFCKDYNRRFAAQQMSFSMINPKDAIPKMPLEYVEGKLFDRKNLDVFFKPEGFDTGLLAKTLLMRPLGRASNTTMKYLSKQIDRQIDRELGQITMPDYVDGINYHQVDNKLIIEPVQYPYVLLDSTILENDSLMMNLERYENGIFVDNSLYESEPMFYQHKPYNYYLSILKIYFREEYELLPNKY